MESYVKQEVELISTIKYMHWYGNLRLPGDHSIEFLDDVRENIHDFEDFFVDEKFWNGYPWNPNTYFEWEYDPNASPKPTWDELLESYHLGIILGDINDNEEILKQHHAYSYGSLKKNNNKIEYILNEDRPDGRAHGGYLKTIDEPGIDVDEIHNKIVSEIRHLQSMADDANFSNKERYNCMIKALRMAQYYPENFQKEIDNYPSHKKYIALLESFACKKIMHIKHTATPDGIDIPDSCDSQEKAIRKIANKKQRGQIDIKRAVEDKEIEKLFDLWKKRIDNVEVEDAPIWTIDGTEITDKNHKIPGQPEGTFTIRSSNPKKGIPGSVLIDKIVCDEEVRYQIVIPKEDENSHDVIFTISPNYSGEITLEARNICGPSVLVIDYIGNRSLEGNLILPIVNVYTELN